ncbi:MAG: ABC transporter permease [SAR324 cluster bacterium]|nr:ABC transporter permease [SAR324 cluster bacterium]
MIYYIGRRLIQLIPVLLGVSLIVFAILHAIPGDPALVILGEGATPQAVDALRNRLGLDDPLYIQYWAYLKRILSGDLGISILTHRPIAQEVFPYLAATAELAISSLIFAFIVGVNAGIVAAWKRGSRLDYLAMLIAIAGVSVPVFWFGLMEQFVFAQKLRLLPTVGRFNVREPLQVVTNFYILDTILTGDWARLWDVLKHLILPSVALAMMPMAVIARMTRSSMLEVMKADYIRTARAKGISGFWVIYKHALKNAFAPILTITGILLGALLGGAILTETIFGWPGIGRYIYGAISARDYPVVQSSILIVSFVFVVINLLVDILYAYLDPRVRY